MANACRLQRFGNGAGLEPMTRGRRRIDPHLQRRNIRLGLRSEVNDTLHLRHLGLHLTGELSQDSIVAKDLDRDVRTGAREHVIDAMRDRLSDRDVRSWEQRRFLPQLLDHLFTRPILHFEANIDFCRLDALCVLISSARPMRRAVDVTSRTLSISRSSALPNAFESAKLVQDRDGADGQGTFVELGQERSACGKMPTIAATKSAAAVTKTVCR